MARKNWCRQEDLNPQPPDYKSVALPTELMAHVISLSDVYYNNMIFHMNAIVFLKLSFDY